MPAPDDLAAPVSASTTALPAGVPQPRTPDRADLLLAWAQAADAADELELALALWDGAADAGATTVGTGAPTAHALVVSGEPEAALRVLAEAGLDDVPPDGPRCAEHVVALAARAASGDQAELSRLLAVGAALQAGPHRVAYLYLLAVAAECSGHPSVADDAWRRLVVEHGVSTPLTTSRFVAGWVAGRDAVKGPAVVARVMQAAVAVRDTVPRPWHDAVVVEGAVRALEARGDAAGAALLTLAVQRTSPRSDALTALKEATKPPVRRWTQVVTAVAAAVVVALLWASPGLAILAAIGVVAGVRALVRTVPTFSRADDAAWLRIGRLRFDERRGRTTDSETQLRIVPVLAAVLGIVVGFCLLAWVSESFVTSGTSDASVVSMWVVGMLALPAGAVLGAKRLMRAYDVRVLRRRQMAEDRHVETTAATCRCWDSSGFRGVFAAAYTTAHLRPTTDPAPAVPGGRASTVLACPMSGVRWLATVTDSGRTALVLRGTAPGPAGPETSPAPGTGGYL